MVCFLAQDDIGISGVIGSAIFNITLVIAVCALAAEHTFTLSWYSVLRDCSCYLISTAILLAAIADEKIYWLVSGLLTNSILFCWLFTIKDHSVEKCGVYFTNTQSRFASIVLNFVLGPLRQVSGTEMREFLRRTKDNNILPDEGSLVFHKMET